MANHLTPTADYDHQLEQKVALTQNEFKHLYCGEIDVFKSPATAFRMRAEFKIWQNEGQVSYAMYEPGAYKRPIIIDKFEPGYHTIQTLMPALLQAINLSEPLKKRLFQLEFLCARSGETLISLIYHRPLDELWQQAAEALRQQFNIHIVGRSRKQKLVIGQDCVYESYEVNGAEFKYQQIESSFTQPNAYICEHMLNWAVNACKDFDGDLLELYCGNGNFTLPLSRQFSKVVATEISKVSIQSALLNCKENQVNNIEFLRMSSEEFTQAYDGVRPFRRLQNLSLDEYNFSTVLVDPPRAGLDEGTCSLVSRFENIIYISCNPSTLLRDLEVLSSTHEVEKLALFDQFPYTNHRECGVQLRRKRLFAN